MDSYKIKIGHVQSCQKACKYPTHLCKYQNFKNNKLQKSQLP
jgi:hypothetical protein